MGPLTAAILLLFAGAREAKAEQPTSDSTCTSEMGLLVVDNKDSPGAKNLARHIAPVFADGSWKLVRPTGPANRKLAPIAKRCAPDVVECGSEAAGVFGTRHVLVAIPTREGEQVNLSLAVVDASSRQIVAQRTGNLRAKSWLEGSAAMARELLGKLPEPVGSQSAQTSSANTEFQTESRPDETYPDNAPAAIPGSEEKQAPEPAVTRRHAAQKSSGPKPSAVKASETAPVISSEPAEIRSQAISSEPLPESAPEMTSERAWSFGVGLHFDLLVPMGNSGAPTYQSGTLSPEGGRSPTVAVLAEGRFFILPEPVADLGILLEAGWYHYGQSAERSNAADPDFASFSYSSSMQMLPILFGPVYRLGLQSRLNLPFEVYAMGGIAAQYIWAKTTYTSGGVDVTDATQSDFGWGYFLGGEAAFVLGPGALTAGIRFTSVRTDLKFKDTYNGVYNKDLGDTGGTSLLVGYRLEM
jgi:hypothetical protein